MEENTGFGMPKSIGPFDEYIGKYIIIHPKTGAGTFAGRLVDIRDGFGILNPYQGAECDRKIGPLRKIIPKNSKIEMGSVLAIEPTTKRDLEAYCDYYNSKDQNTK